MNIPGMGRFKTLEERWVRFVLHRPWWTMALVLALFVAFASGGRHLVFDTNYRVFFSDTNPELKTLDAFERNYTQSDNILIVVRPPGGDVFDAESLAVIERITEKAWSIPNAIRVDSITNFQNSWADRDTLVVEPLVEGAAGLSGEQRSAKRKRALGEPLLRGGLVSPDGSTTGVNVTIQYPLKSSDEVPETVNHARKLVAEIQAEHPGYEIALSGLILLNHAFAETGERDMASLVPAMYGILVLATVLIVRSFAAAFATLLVIALSTGVAMGSAGYLGIPLSPISAAAPTIILTLAVADSLHLILSTFAGMRGGQSRLDALAGALRANLFPITITSATTALGFISLNFAESPVFWHLGNITAIGIVAAWLFSLTLLPALLARLPLKARRSIANSRRIGRLLGRIADFASERRIAVLSLTAVVIVAFVSFAPSMKLDDNFVKYFDFDIPFRGDVEFTMKHLTGTYRVEYSVPAGRPGGVNDPAYLAHLTELTEWLRGEPEVRHVYSYSDIVKRINMNMHEDDPASYRVPEAADLAAQYLLLYEMSLPYGLGLNDRIVLDRSASRVTVTLDDISMAEVRRFNRRVARWMAERLPPSMKAEPTGVAVMFSHISKRNIEGMLGGNMYALVAISLLLMVMFRSLRLGLISLVTNIAPIALSFGVWAAVVGEVGMAAATVAAVSLGIIVDDTIHFLARYLRATRGGLGHRDALIESAETVGRAVVMISLIMIVGFMVLGASSFRVNVQMGLLTAIALSFGMLFTMTVTPALLSLGAQRKESR